MTKKELKYLVDIQLFIEAIESFFLIETKYERVNNNTRLKHAVERMFELVGKAKEVFAKLVDLGISVAWDDRGNIGKRYFAQDEIGTPYCITIDYQTLEDGTVTIRDRDTMKQERVEIEDLVSKI